MADQHANTDSPGLDVLDPIAEEDFFANYWEKQPLHIARSSVNPFGKLISVSAIERLLSTNELFYPSVQLSHAGQTIPAAQYTNERNKIIGARVVEGYRRGDTVVMTHMHKLHAELMDLCRIVQRRFMMRCQTNVYLSPAGNQGFNPHFDTHDVFILQVSGSKTFNFYSGGSSFPTSADSFDSKVHKIGSLTESVSLSAGDTLYIPRGFTHDAVASDAVAGNDEPSLHVTLGVYPILMYELLQEIVHISTALDIEARKAVPQTAWMSTDSTTSTVHQIKSILQKHFSEDVVSLALSRLRDSVALEATKNANNSLQNAEKQSLHLCTVVRVNHDSILQLERSGDVLKLRSYGTYVEFDEPFSSSVEWLIEQSKCQTECNIESMPGLDSDQRLALLEKLREHDLVTLC